MTVVSARVHLSVDLTAKWHISCFVNWQGIHVGAQADAPGAGAAARQHPDHAGAADLAVHLDPPGGEFFGHDAGGADLLEAEFGMGMEIAPDGGERVEVGGDAVDRGHAAKTLREAV